MPQLSTSTRAQLAPVQFAEPWGGTGYLTDLGGPTHWIDFGGPKGEAELPPLLFVHGLGGSHLNWVRVAQAFTAKRRVVALDLAGFGLTRAAGRRTTVGANSALVARFVREVLGTPALLVGNSMGGMISILTASVHPDVVAAMVLVDPALPLPAQRPDLEVARNFLLYSTPGVGELVMLADARRHTPRQLVDRTTELCFADPARADEETQNAATALATHRRLERGNEAAFLWAARSLMVVSARKGTYRSRWMGIDVPTMLIHGAEDRLVSIEAARALATDRPDWTSEFLPGVGHVPQLEVPELFAEHVGAWVDKTAVLGQAGRKFDPGA